VTTTTALINRDAPQVANLRHGRLPICATGGITSGGASQVSGFSDYCGVGLPAAPFATGAMFSINRGT
jgi:hypothetical protein